VTRSIALSLIACLAACAAEPAASAPDPASSLSRPRPVAPAPASPAPAAAAPTCGLESRPLAREAPGRLVAIGDVHGDLRATRAALRLAGAIDAQDRWVGGALGVVQLGDILDRGNDEQAIIDLFERLETQAAAAGGTFTWLLGNHELMNAAGDFRYVTDGGWRDFSDAPEVDLARLDRPELAAALARAPAHMRARLAAFGPGGTYARILAGQDVVVQIGDTVFSHAGILPGHDDALPGGNRDARCWLQGAGAMPEVAVDDEGPVWTRVWGHGAADCALLGAVLDSIGARRMVVAHTPQLQGITSDCDGRLWRIDTGMSRAYGGPVQVLELTAGDGGVRVLRGAKGDRHGG